jgi:N-acetylneuraminic acid mutarotase
LDGQIYVVGGFEAPAFGNVLNLSISDKVEVYDPRSDRWSVKAPLPVGLHHAGLVAVGRQLYVVGGYTRSGLSAWKPVASLYRYDPQEDRWSEGTPMPTPRGALALAVVNGRILAIGGYNGDINVPTVEEYDPQTDRWTARAPLPVPRDHLAAANDGRFVYAIGGRLNGSYSQNVALVHQYDPDSDHWTQRADLPTARSGITAAVLADRIYVFGGEAPSGTFTTTEAYKPVSNSWQTMAPMPTGRHGLGSAVVGDRIFVIAGGPKPGGSFSNVNEVFAPPHDGLGTKTSQKALPAHVGSVMAMLATLSEAGVLPPEGTGEANRVIKSLIQFQSAMMKSTDLDVRTFFEKAVERKFGSEGPTLLETARRKGWTSEVLEAVAEFATGPVQWDQPRLDEGWRAYNVTQSDLLLLAGLFTDARTRFSSKRQNIHDVFSSKRRSMPGAGQSGRVPDNTM